MATEAMDRGGSPILTKGFYGGSFIESRIGLPPTELYNVGSSKDRQIVFYNGVAQLAGFRCLYELLEIWRGNEFLKI